MRVVDVWRRISYRKFGHRIDPDKLRWGRVTRGAFSTCAVKQVPGRPSKPVVSKTPLNRTIIPRLADVTAEAVPITVGIETRQFGALSQGRLWTERLLPHRRDGHGRRLYLLVERSEFGSFSSR